MVLSSISESNIHIECLMEDEDLNYMLSRKQFEDIIQEVVLNKFKTLIANFYINEIKQKNIKIHSVELVGGGSRIPCI